MISHQNTLKSKNNELSAVRQRIGTILSSNHVLDETTQHDFFKRDITNLQNTVNLTTESGIAPAKTNYPRQILSDDGGGPS